MKFLISGGLLVVIVTIGITSKNYGLATVLKGSRKLRLGLERFEDWRGI